MDCSVVRTRLPRYVDNDLPREARREVDDHLKHCYLCLEDLQEMLQVTEACRAALRHPVPTDRFHELQVAMRDAPSASPLTVRPRRHLFGKFATAAALAALMLLIVNVAMPTISTARQWASVEKFIAAYANHTTFEEELKRQPTPTVINWRQRLQTVQTMVDDPNKSVSREASNPETEREPESVSMRAGWMLDEIAAASPIGAAELCCIHHDYSC